MRCPPMRTVVRRVVAGTFSRSRGVCAEALSHAASSGVDQVRSELIPRDRAELREAAVARTLAQALESLDPATVASDGAARAAVKVRACRR